MALLRSGINRLSTWRPDRPDRPASGSPLQILHEGMSAVGHPRPDLPCDYARVDAASRGWLALITFDVRVYDWINSSSGLLAGNQKASLLRKERQEDGKKKKKSGVGEGKKYEGSGNEFFLTSPGIFCTMRLVFLLSFFLSFLFCFGFGFGFLFFFLFVFFL